MSKASRFLSRIPAALAGGRAALPIGIAAALAVAGCDDTKAGSDSDVVVSITDRVMEQPALGSPYCKVSLTARNNTDSRVDVLEFWLNYGPRRSHNRLRNVPDGKSEYVFESRLHQPCETLPELTIDIAECRLLSGEDCTGSVAFRP